MTTSAIQKQAALDALLELVTERLEAALELIASASRERRLAELGELCADLQVLIASALRVRGA